MGYRYLGAKELWSVPVFTRQGGISRAECLRVCPALAMQAYLDRTSSELYRHSDMVYPFQHVFMSQIVPTRASGYHLPVGAQTCSRWMLTVMTRVGISIRSTKVALFAWLQLRQLSTVVCHRCSAQHRPMGQLAGIQPFLQPSSSTRCGPEHWPNFVGLGSPFNTRQSWPSQPTLYSLGMTMVVSIVWWRLESVDSIINFFMGASYGLQAKMTSVRGVADRLDI